jgi:hypothetical protein
MQGFLEGGNRRAEKHAGKKCAVIILGLTGVVDAVRDAGGYLAASYRLIPGSEGRAGKFNWEY